MPLIGEIRAFGFGAHSPGFTDAVQQGWIPCDGRALAISVYSDLSRMIGVTWGAEIPGVNFCVPNLFGSFLRGATLWVADTNDPDVSLRGTPRPDLAHQGDAGGNVGSFQDDSFRSHAHSGRGKKAGGYAVNNGLALTAVNGGPSDSRFGMSSEGGQETRPKNHYVMYMIYAGSDTSVETINKILEDYAIEED